MRKSMHFGVLAGFLMVLGLVIYFPGLSGPLFFDDKPALVANERVQIDGAVFDEWRAAAFSSNAGPLRRPIAMASFAANHAVTGNFSPFDLKLVNLAVHFAICLILYFFFRLVLEALAIGPDSVTRQLLALTAAAIWLLHPLNVSTVLYAVQRMAQLSTLFVSAGLLVFMRYRHRWAQIGASSGELLAAALWLLLLTILAALSKENGALLPWLIIVLEVSIFRGVWAGRPSQYLVRLGWVLLVLPFLLIIVMVVIGSESLVGGYTSRQFTLEERLFTQGRLLWRYLGWICLPNINDMGFQHDDIPVSTGLFAPLTTFVSLVAWPVFLVVALLLRKRYPLLLLASLFFLVGHSMESSVLPLEMVYEHRNYMPGILICLGLAALLVIPAARFKKVSVWYPILGVVMIYSLLLAIRVHTWSDEMALSEANIAHHPNSPRSNYIYANTLLKQYLQGEELGMPERERSVMLLLSRHHFERMYELGQRDLAALVMLFYLDSHNFPDLQRQVDWVTEIEALLITGTLQPSDWNALATLFEMLSSNPGLLEEVRVRGLLDTLSQRYPHSARTLRFQYQYLSALGAKSTDLLPLLQRAQELAPRAPWVYYALMSESAREENVAGIYDSAGLWLRHDRSRYYLHPLKALFTPAGTYFNSVSDSSYEQ